MTMDEPKLLRGRTAIVTGAGGGIGRGLAQALAGAGANVVIAARRAATGDETLALISAEGGQAISVQTDGPVPTRVLQVNSSFPGTLRPGSKLWQAGWPSLLLRCMSTPTELPSISAISLGEMQSWVMVTIETLRNGVV